jgi:hypothetical protein
MSNHRPHITYFSTPAVTRKFSAIPQYYTRLDDQPPTFPGWYFCWCGSRANYLYWPGDWVGVTCYVELPEFVQWILEEVPATPL